MSAFQDQLRGNLCWGCGADNPQGLQIKSDWDGDEAVCHYRPAPHHAAGPPNVLNGGIIGVLIDCHSVCTAMAHAYRVAGRPIGSEPLFWFATAEMRVSYLLPTPLDAPVELRARVRETSGRRITVECTLRANGVECARGEVVAVQVKQSWGMKGEA